MIINTNRINNILFYKNIFEIKSFNQVRFTKNKFGHNARNIF